MTTLLELGLTFPKQLYTLSVFPVFLHIPLFSSVILCEFPCTPLIVFLLYVFSNSPLYSIVFCRFSLHSLCSMYSPVFPCMHSSVFVCISVSHEFPRLPFPALSCSPLYIPLFPYGICCWQAYTDSLLLFCRCEGLHVDSLSMFRSNCCVLQQFSSVLLYDMIGSFFYKHFSAMADFGLNSISASVFSVTPILGDVW